MALRLVFLHGRFENSTTWIPLTERLSEQLQGARLLVEFLAVELDDPGASTLEGQARALLELIEHTSPRSRIVLVGHDTGGALAQVAAALAPERVRGLVLLNTASPFRPCTRLPLEKLVLAGLHTLLPEYARDILSSSSRQGSHAQWPEPEESKGWKQVLSAQSIPALLLWGSGDHFQSLECAREAYLIFSQARFSTCECGHWPHLESVEWTADRMQEFIFRLRYGTNRDHEKESA